MTKLIDANRVLKGYYAMHNAIRADVAQMEAYTFRPQKHRQAARADFKRWFEHHRRMNGEHNYCEDNFFFPRFQEFLHDGGDFVNHMKRQDKDLHATAELVLAAFAEPDDTSLLQHLRAYMAGSLQHIQDEETICVPIMMEHFTRETLRAVEKKYVKTLSVAQLSLILPWMLTRLSPEIRQNKDDGLRSLPLPIRLIYVYRWEPYYVKHFRF